MSNDLRSLVANDVNNDVVSKRTGSTDKPRSNRVGVSVYIGKESKIAGNYIYSAFGNDIGFLKPFGFDKGIEALPENASDKQRVYRASLLAQHENYKFMLDVCNEMLANNIKQRIISKDDIDAEIYKCFAKLFGDFFDAGMVIIFNNNMISNNSDGSANADDVVDYI